MKRWLWLAVIVVLYGLGAWLIVVNRHASELRAAALYTQGWDSRRGRTRLPPRAEVEAMTEPARSMLRSACELSGGDTMGRNNCYADAAAWMRRRAREHEERREYGYAVCVLASAGAAITLMIERRRRKLSTDWR